MTVRLFPAALEQTVAHLNAAVSRVRDAEEMRLTELTMTAGPSDHTDRNGGGKARRIPSGAKALALLDDPSAGQMRGAFMTALGVRFPQEMHQ